MDGLSIITRTDFGNIPNTWIQIKKKKGNKSFCELETFLGE